MAYCDYRIVFAIAATCACSSADFAASKGEAGAGPVTGGSGGSPSARSTGGSSGANATAGRATGTGGKSSGSGGSSAHGGSTGGGSDVDGGSSGTSTTGGSSSGSNGSGGDGTATGGSSQAGSDDGGSGGSVGTAGSAQGGSGGDVSPAGSSGTGGTGGGAGLGAAGGGMAGQGNGGLGGTPGGGMGGLIAAGGPNAGSGGVLGGCDNQLLGNADFEAGPGAPWTEETTWPGLEIIVPKTDSQLVAEGVAPYAGTYLAWLGGVPDNEWDHNLVTLSQDVTLPADAATLTLSGRRWVKSVDDSSEEFDIAFLEFADQDDNLAWQAQAWSNQDTTNGWVAFEKSTSVDPQYRGKKLTFVAYSNTDPEGKTSFFLDSLRLEASCGR